MTHTLTDKEYHQLTISIGKALNSYEMPVKSKHVRATIISTYHSNGGNLYWVATLKQPLQENRITAWKCCYLLHKVLREGHHLVPQHSMRQRHMLTELGKLWGHLNDGYGLCIKHYTKLLVTKLNFHDRNPRIPGNIVLRKGELEKMAGNDINLYFQLSIEMFDYLDDIIALQATIFNSMNQFNVSSMTAPGQLRLTPLIPCIQDSNQLYDFSVRLMFLLHANLPDDLLLGHRDRFRAIFKQLNNFYKQAGQLQYFTTLIKVPKLPHNQPNFLVQSDLGNYTAPVVVVPETESDNNSIASSIVDNLVDMSPEPESQAQAPEIPPRMKTPPPLPAIDFDRLLKERDELIRHLQQELEKLHHITRHTTQEKHQLENRMQEEIARARSELNHTREELTNMRIEKEEIELKLEAAESQSMEQQKSMLDEEKAKASEEKFQKLKNMYTQIRDEHIKLLRQHGEVSKQLAENAKNYTEIQQENEKMKVEIEESRIEKSKVQENLLQSSNMIQKEKESLVTKVSSMEQEYSNLQTKLQEVEKSKNSELNEINSKFQEKVRELDILQAKLNENTDNFKVTEEKLLQSSNMVQNEKENLEKKISSVEQKNSDLQMKLDELEKSKTSEINDMKSRFDEKVQELDILKAKLNENTDNFKITEEKLLQSSNEVNKQREDIENKLKIVQSENEKLSLQLESLENTKNAEINSLQEKCIETENQFKESSENSNNEIESLKQKISDHEKNYQQTMSNYDRVLKEKENIEVDFQDLMHQQEMVEKKNMEIVQQLEQQKADLKIHGDIQIRTLLEACIKTSESITMRAITECEAGACGTSTYFIMIAEELQDVLTKLKIVHENYTKDGENNMEALVRKVQSLGHLMASIHEQGMTICNKTTNIENGEKIVNEFKNLGSHTSQLFKSLYTPDQTVKVSSNIEELKSDLFKITSMIGDLTNDNDVIDKLGDLVEKELSSMDKAIEEAAQKIVEMLQQTKTTDSGIKLEVNEKILDACTDLMRAIKILVQKSRKVQKEIIQSGKGTSTSKEFYKRNHQWTEGLISASKSVANGAKILVEAANKAVTGESNHTFDVIVAAQEISACVAQLVVASRVKAPKSSQNVHELSDASKAVTQKTGFVVATAKDCIQKLEDGQEIDFSKLSQHQAKTREMEVQVKVLEYEKLLETERMKLATLRKQNYQSE